MSPNNASIQNLIKQMRELPDCVVFPSTRLPESRPEHTLPEDIQQFYQLCGL